MFEAYLLIASDEALNLFSHHQQQEDQRSRAPSNALVLVSKPTQQQQQVESSTMNLFSQTGSSQLMLSQREQGATNVGSTTSAVDSKLDHFPANCNNPSDQQNSGNQPEMIKKFQAGNIIQDKPFESTKLSHASAIQHPLQPSSHDNESLNAPRGSDQNPRQQAKAPLIQQQATEDEASLSRCSWFFDKMSREKVKIFNQCLIS